VDVRESLLVGACIGAVLSGFVFAYVAPAISSPDPAPKQQAPLSRDRVKVILEGEFQLHHQDCIILSIWTSHDGNWTEFLKTYECGRGTIPSNPIPPDGGPSVNWEWEEYGMR